MRSYWMKIGFCCLAIAFGGALLLGGRADGKTPKSKDRLPENSRLTVHEWGTFLSMQGSDGVSLGGMVDSEEALPLFVESREDPKSRVRSLIRQKMETPVTYFYTDQPQAVEVRVDMPQGILTHWFPVAFELGPNDDKGKRAATEGSFINWGKIQLIPDPGVKYRAADLSSGLLKKTDSESTWRFARDTDSAFVKVHSGKFPEKGRTEYDFEKFLFYRGLGAFDLPLHVRSKNQGDDVHLVLENRGQEDLKGLVAVQVEKKSIRFALLGDLAGRAVMEGEESLLLSRKAALDEGVTEVKDALLQILVSAGLFPKEAGAMVNTWEKSYFRTEGLRILGVLPRETVDSIIPIRIKPEPESLARVMVGRVEVLTPEREGRIERWVADLASGDTSAHEQAEKGLASLGRFQEPILRRIASLSRAGDVAARAKSLLDQSTK